jgi:hypothetical protein
MRREDLEHRKTSPEFERGRLHSRRMEAARIP